MEGLVSLSNEIKTPTLENNYSLNNFNNNLDSPIGLKDASNVERLDSKGEWTNNVLLTPEELDKPLMVKENSEIESFTFDKQTIDNFELETKRPEIETDMILGAEHNADTLRYNMSVSMEEVPPKELSNAHHLIGNDTPEAAKKLAEYEIDRNDPANGIFLPNSPESPLKGSEHGQGRHIASYSNEVEQRFVNVSSREDALEALQSLKEDLYKGNLPLHY